MATNKVTFTKLGIKKNTNLISLNWNDQIIEIKEYLPIQDKLDLIGKVVNQSLDDNNFLNPARLEIFTTLEIIYAYTNITFTEKQKENFLNIYDVMISSGLWGKIKEILEEHNEYAIIQKTIYDVIDEVYKFKNSALGILQAISEDYSQMDLDAEKIKAKLEDKNDLKLLKDVVDKLG